MRFLRLATLLIPLSGCTGAVERSARTDVAVVTADYKQGAGLHWEIRLGAGQRFLPVKVDGSERWCSSTPGYFPDMWIMTGPQQVCLRDSTGRGRFDQLYVQWPRPFRSTPDHEVNVPYVLDQGS